MKSQFRRQAAEELVRLYEVRNKAWKEAVAELGFEALRKGDVYPALDDCGQALDEQADANIKMCWVEQGVWRDCWDDQKDPPGCGSKRSSSSSRRRKQIARSTSTRARRNLGRDINTIAYERVKAIWERWQIWDAKWGVLSGMSWKHEQPYDEFLGEELDIELEDGEA
ncbi:hypothetical protein VTK56DRAFT_4692 [Thermocarpiscus australiensis]